MTLPRAASLAVLAAATVALAACGGSSGGSGGGTGDSTATSTSMNPGRDCTQCHGFTLAGTVYASSTATVGSAGVTGASVRVTDANAATFTLVSDLQGSFYTSRAVAAPVTVSIDLGGSSAAMSGTIAYTHGSQIGCGSCHGQAQPVVHVP